MDLSKVSYSPSGEYCDAILGVEVVMIQSLSNKFIDYHTHAGGCDKYVGDTDTIVVQSLHYAESPHDRADFVTLGIHPMLEGAAEVLEQWKQTPDILLDKWCDKIKEFSKPVIALGECGWDHRSPLSEEDQELLMDFHIALSQRLSLPIVFHIVGAWHHLLRKHKEINPSESWIVHGFRGKPQLAEQLIQAKILLSLHPKAEPPTDTIFFLESDEDPSLVSESYARMANKLGETQMHLIERISSFFHTIHKL